MNHQVLHFASPEAVFARRHGWPGFSTGPFASARLDRMRMLLGVRIALIGRGVKEGVAWFQYLCDVFGVGTAAAALADGLHFRHQFPWHHRAAAPLDV